MAESVALIIGAGPAGLTAAYELLQTGGFKPIVLEMTGDIGGIAKTVNYKGNRIDIGGHRFFSKSDRVMDWWLKLLPMQAMRNGNPAGIRISRGQAPGSAGSGPDPETTDRVMLVRNRLSRIFFLRRFFDYPISLSLATIANLGPARIARIGCSLLWTRLSPRREERSLEDFLINRFGRELYQTFFKDYTQKVWGVPCDRISPDWGAQRIKGLSLTKAIGHAMKKACRGRDSNISQKSTETSLIDRFLYPKYGPGQLWEIVADLVRRGGGEIHQHHEVVRLLPDNGRVIGLEARDHQTGRIRRFTGDYVFSTMPVQQLIRGIDGVPVPVREVADGLTYRDFITVGVLLRKMTVCDRGRGAGGNGDRLIPDNWIYIQERDVRVGRLQIFNNWSPYLVRDPQTVWLGMEYFCQEGDDLWSRPDPELSRFAADELARIGMIDPADVLDSVVIRMPKTYPAYFGTYNRFREIREYLENFENLFLIGRNGMHRYNNQDHSMLTAMTAVENVVSGRRGTDNIWNVNAEQEYHEEKAKAATA